MSRVLLLVVGLALALSAARCQSTGSAHVGHAQPGGKAEASVPVQDRYEEEEEEEEEKEESHVTPRKQYARLAKDSKLGIFMAASLGTLTLMGAVYCIYSQFYTKSPYSRTRLRDDAELTLDLTEPSASFLPSDRAPASGEEGPWKGGYGSMSDAPSVIPWPPAQTLVPPAAPFPPRSLGRTPPLQTISAQDLEKSFV